MILSTAAKAAPKLEVAHVPEENQTMRKLFVGSV